MNHATLVAAAMFALAATLAAATVINSDAMQQQAAHAAHADDAGGADGGFVSVDTAPGPCETGTFCVGPIGPYELHVCVSASQRC